MANQSRCCSRLPRLVLLPLLLSAEIFFGSSSQQIEAGRLGGFLNAAVNQMAKGRLKQLGFQSLGAGKYFHPAFNRELNVRSTWFLGGTFSPSEGAIKLNPLYAWNRSLIDHEVKHAFNDFAGKGQWGLIEELSAMGVTNRRSQNAYYQLQLELMDGLPDMGRADKLMKRIQDSYGSFEGEFAGVAARQNTMLRLAAKAGLFEPVGEMRQLHRFSESHIQASLEYSGFTRRNRVYGFSSVDIRNPRRIAIDHFYASRLESGGMQEFFYRNDSRFSVLGRAVPLLVAGALGGAGFGYVFGGGN